MTNRDRALKLLDNMGLSRSGWAHDRDVREFTAELDAAERRGAIKVLEFANGPAEWNDLADLQYWLTDEFDLDDSIHRLTEAKRLAELKAEETKR